MSGDAVIGIAVVLLIGILLFVLLLIVSGGAE